jgi:hypothetical protein
MLVLAGLMVAAYAVAALFFLRFWRQSGDRLFALFSAAFWLLGAQRLALALLPESPGLAVWPYVVRLLAFLLILWAIVDKNRERGRPGPR